ncbi:MAG: ATP synthase F0 subunit B [Vampirovibrionales bacterium]|nr:ATP synthase F0 subunit B [Vampirovibrionales bacterium]
MSFPSLFPFHPVLLTASASAEGDGSLLSWLLSSNVFNIALVAVLLGFLIKRLNLFKGFADKQRAVAQEIESAQRRKQEALSALEQIQGRMQTIQGDIDAILSQAQSAAETLSTQMLTDAQAEAQKIVDAARARIEVEQKTAAKMLETRLLKEALSDTRQELKRLPQDAQQRAIDDFIDALPTARAQGQLEQEAR